MSDPIDTLLEAPMKCVICADDGWYPDHGDGCYQTKQCQGECPVQRRCKCQIPETERPSDEEPF